MEFGEQLKALRERIGISQYQLAKDSGVSQPYLSDVEAGKRGTPSPDILRKLAPALRMSHGELMKIAGHIDSSSDTFLDVEGIIGKIAKDEGTPQAVVDEALRRIAVARETLSHSRVDDASPKRSALIEPSTILPELKDQLAKLSLDEQRHLARVLADPPARRLLTSVAADPNRDDEELRTFIRVISKYIPPASQDK